MEEKQIVKNEVSKVIADTRKVISDFENKFRFKEAELKGFKDIKAEFKKIIGQLDRINEVVNIAILLYQQFGEYLDQQQDELKHSSMVLYRCCKEQLIDLINENLPDEMSIRKLENRTDIWKVVLIKNYNNMSLNSLKELKKICFYKKEEKTIGEILLMEDMNELMIKIKILGDSTCRDFRIDNALKVFPIVNHIITRYNYKEGMVSTDI